MKEKFKWVFFYGGLGWGVSFTLIMSVIRDIQDKPVAFGSYPLFLTICIFGGMIFGSMMFKYTPSKKSGTQSVNLEKVSKVLLVWGIILSFYGLIIKFLLVPLDYQNTTGANILKWFIWGIILYLTNIITEDKKKPNTQIQ
jgi:hypothetical protein